MRLIDADDLLAKVQENAPGFMGSGSTITKAFIMAMINTKSVAPTIDAVPVVRCKDCKWRNTNACFCISKDDVQDDWYCSEAQR